MPAARIFLLALSATVTLSSFLLFQIQPIVAKFILPWFGGGPAVWTICMLFFQGLLLAGYTYAHGVVKYLSRTRQVQLHLALLLASLLFLSVIPDATWKPTASADPTWQILLLLVSTVGPSYFLLSATAPLIQSWFSYGEKSGSPYWLYAVSNASSLMALLSYPVLIEPFLTQGSQAMYWRLGYIGFVFLAALSGWCVLKGGKDRDLSKTDSSAKPPGLTQYLFWFGFAFTASVLLLAVTNEVCQDVAVIPFLWVLPLSIYLLTFIFCFASPKFYLRSIFIPFVVISLFFVTQTSFVLLPQESDFRFDIGFWCSALFIYCMVCHGELSRSKPAPQYLTSFYMMISLAGALGGIFVGIIAPRIFSSYFELPVGVLLLLFLLLVLLLQDEPRETPKQKFVYVMSLALYAGIAISGMVIIYRARDDDTNIVAQTRNFYGVLKVTEDVAEDDDAYRLRALEHGRIIHGSQYLDSEREMIPTTYYGQGTGVALAVKALRGEQTLRMGIVGLGAGTMAAHGEKGDYIRYYEINPRVVEISQQYFTFVPKSKAKVEVALGDARLSLEREPGQNFDLIVLDAFTGDAIPTHLLTREAFTIYLRHLAPTGIIAAHISNNYFDLNPVLRGIAQDHNLEGILVSSDDSDDLEIYSSDWVLLSRDASVLKRKGLRRLGEPLRVSDGVEHWSDDYTSLFKLIAME